jgi:hypothetical protein
MEQVGKHSLRFDWNSEGTTPPPDLDSLPRSYFDLRREWEVIDDPPPRRPGLRLEHLPAIVFIVCLALALVDEGARRLKALGLADQVGAEVAAELDAFQTAGDGLSCLAGTGPCPGGRPSPFR